MDKGVSNLIDKALTGDALALGRLARIIDDDLPEAGEILARTYPLGGRAHIVGITGPPGAGKSSLVSALIREARSAGRRVGVLAVDPTSPFTGGAVLGDRVRMQEHATDAGVFIRSLATRGHVGGLSGSVLALCALLDAAGFDLILVETVGVGQEEVQVKDLAHTTAYVTVPGLGDGVQALKAGVLEIAHVFVVNKADLPEASASAADLTAMLSMAESRGGWSPPVLSTVAVTGQGVAELLGVVEAHHRHLSDTVGLDRWARASVALSIRGVMEDAVAAAVETLFLGAEEGFAADIERVSRRETDPVTVAKKWLSQLDFKNLKAEP